VGDCNQLPNVVTDEMKKLSDAIFNSYKLSQGYSFSENSFLESICNIIEDVPQTLLREHYRCHPKIIGYCNQKYYNNELIIMTEDNGEADTLSVYKTTSGNHRRDRMNQRQIDVTVQEVLPKLNSSKVGDVGIIAPYRDQVAAISKKLNKSEIEIDTVHKFQGREKDTIVLTTVDDVVTEFSDDPNLLNVAISRAKKRFCLVVSGNNQPVDSNIGDLISYIEYNNFQVVESEIYSVFDMLYQHYTDARIAFLRKHSRVSKYDSENLMYGAIVDILKSRPQLSLNVICHQPLNMLIRDPKHLNDEECRYAMNTATHVDFLIYNRITKRAVLAIEVDGFHYHKPGTRLYERDLMKDRILALYGIPLLRFPTNGSREIEQIKQALDKYEKSR
jgi:very-short-patch-repair endonuclease